jgi:hypothetical protein
MGSANYTIKDPCPAKGASSKILDELAPAAVWRLEQGLLVRGTKTPGTRVPMLGLIEKGKLAWKQAVPDGNPLEYAEGAVRTLAISKDAAFAALAKRDHSKHYVSAFSLRDGKRLWQTELEERDSVDRLTFNGGVVFVERDDHLLALDATSGKQRYALGELR